MCTQPICLKFAKSTKILRKIVFVPIAVYVNFLTISLVQASWDPFIIIIF